MESHAYVQCHVAHCSMIELLSVLHQTRSMDGRQAGALHTEYRGAPWHKGQNSSAGYWMGRISLSVRMPSLSTTLMTKLGGATTSRRFTCRTAPETLLSTNPCLCGQVAPLAVSCAWDSAPRSVSTCKQLGARRHGMAD